MQWHPLFTRLLRPIVEEFYDIELNVPVGEAPREADIVLLQKKPGGSRHFKGVWSGLTTWSILEFKSPAVVPTVRDIDLLIELGLGIDRRLNERRVRDKLDQVPPRAVSFWYLANRLTERFLRWCSKRLGSVEPRGAGVWRTNLLERPIYLVSNVDLPLDAESLPLHIVSYGRHETEVAVARYVAQHEEFHKLYSHWLGRIRRLAGPHGRIRALAGTAEVSGAGKMDDEHLRRPRPRARVAGRIAFDGRRRVRVGGSRLRGESPRLDGRIVRANIASHRRRRQPGAAPADSSKNDRDDLPYVVFSLGDGLGRVDAETLRLRERTGLDQLVAPAEVELPPVERVRQLIRDLKSDEELSGLAQLARDLMAVVHLPRAISTPDELPVGGVSDIANRGPLDRLLVSELAHDDLTLAVRVALNEALYLRRESPPRTPPTRRVLLIDSGIRLWGVPRVFATAVALALAATSDKKLEIEAFRASGGSLEPVDLTTRAGLTSHLEALEPFPHPGAALAPFTRLAAARDETCDLVLVTHEDVLGDADFRAALAPVADHALFAATVSRSRSFRLLSLSAAGQKVLRAADLSLDKLVPQPSRRLPGTLLVNPAYDSSLPVILSLNPFPLLLSHSVNRRNVRVSERHGAVAVTRDGRLMHWQKHGNGARQLTALLPPGTLHWFSLDGALVRLEFEEPTIHRAVLFTADLESGECRAFPFETEGNGPLAVCSSGGALLRVFRGHVDVIDLETGRRHEKLDLPPHVNWKRDRFFTNRDDWLALGFDGTSARLDSVRIEAGALKHSSLKPFDGVVLAVHGPSGDPETFGDRVLMLLDRAGSDGPFGVTARGQVISTADGQLVSFLLDLGVPVELLDVSPDGHLVAIRSVQPDDSAHPQHREAILDLKTGQVERRPEAAFGLLDRYIGQSVQPRGLRTRFFGITVADQNRLVLVSRRGERLAIALDAARQSLALEPASLRTSLADSQWIYVGVDPAATIVERPEPVQEFRPIARPPGTRFDLKLAAWRDGSRAYLDSRGMLHLVSSDRSLPEITIVLADGELAAWCSNGMVAGPKYFTGEHETVRPAVVYELIQSFVANLR